MQAIERFCFGENGELHGTRTMNSTQRQACLAVGSLARNLANSGDDRLANHLTNRLETWLDEHEKGTPDPQMICVCLFVVGRERRGRHPCKAALL